MDRFIKKFGEPCFAQIFSTNRKVLGSHFYRLRVEQNSVGILCKSEPLVTIEYLNEKDPLNGRTHEPPLETS